MESKKCANCGTELTGKELVCWGCGKDVTTTILKKKLFVISATAGSICISLIFAFSQFLSYFLENVFHGFTLFALLFALNLMFAIFIFKLCNFGLKLYNIRFQDEKHAGKKGYVPLNKVLDKQQMIYLYLSPFVLIILLLVLRHLF